MPLGHLRQGRADLRPGLSTDSLIDLVEDQSGDGIVLNQNHLERQHQAGQLATGCHLGQRLRLEPDVQLHVQLHALLPVRPSLRQRHQLDR